MKFAGTIHKLGSRMSERQFNLQQVQRNLRDLALQIAKHKEDQLQEDVMNPIMEQLNIAIDNTEKLNESLQDKPQQLNGQVANSINLDADVLYTCGSLELLEPGLYIISAQAGITCKNKTKAIDYMQMGLSENSNICKSCYNSTVLKCELESGYNLVQNLTHLIEVKTPLVLNLWVKCGYIDGSFVLDSEAVKLSAVKL